MKLFRLFLLVGSLSSLLFSSDLIAQQRLDADLTNTSGVQEICMWNSSDVRYGEISKEEIVLKELEAFQDGYAELTIDHFSNDEEVVFSLISATNSNTVFSIKIAGGDVFIINNDGSSGTNVGSYANGDVFRIERQLDQVFYYRGSTKYEAEGTVGVAQKLYSRVEVVKAIAGQGEKPRISLGFPNIISPTQYISLKTQLDGSYSNLVTNILRFQYVENYAIVANENDVINCTIYDWTGTSVSTKVLPNIYGMNWKEWSLPSLVSGDFYIMEMGGTNKGEKYYLRFKIDN